MKVMPREKDHRWRFRFRLPTHLRIAGLAAVILLVGTEHADGGLAGPFTHI
jgi:hypothetical protein